MSNPAPSYRERLTPALWVLIAPLIGVPMISLVFLRDSATLALAVSLIAAVGLIAALLASSPVIEVSGGELRVARAHIPVDLLGVAVAATDDEARAARGRNLDARAWRLIRGGIDGVVTVKVTDPADPTPAWVVSSRTPDRLAAAIEAAKVTQRTPGK